MSKKKSKAVDVHKIAAGKDKKKTHQHNPNLAPLDAAEDFDTPAKVEPEGDAQAPLIADSEIPVKEIIAVENDRIFVTFVAPHFDTDKDGARTLDLEFSFPVVEAHKGHLPERVERAYEYVLSGEAKRVDVLGIDEQTFDLFETPKSKKPTLHEAECRVLRPVVSAVEETGKGKTRRVIRFVFRFSVPFPHHKFAVENYGKEYWLEMVDTQAKLGE